MRSALSRRWLVAVFAILVVGGGGAAFAAIEAIDDDGIVVCINNSSGAVRVVDSDADCHANERAASLSGPDSEVANAQHADEADHATTADFADGAGDADLIDGIDSTRLMRDYQRAEAPFTFPGGSHFWINVTCPVPQHVLSFGVYVKNMDELGIEPLVNYTGPANARFWETRMENRDPDTPIEMTVGAVCVTAGAPSTLLARATAAEPVFTAGEAP